ncbi:hypothetical protein E4U42_000222, partial [Claviceps africana]
MIRRKPVPQPLTLGGAASNAGGGSGGSSGNSGNSSINAQTQAPGAPSTSGTEARMRGHPRAPPT